MLAHWRRSLKLKLIPTYFDMISSSPVELRGRRLPRARGPAAVLVVRREQLTYHCVAYHCVWVWPTVGTFLTIFRSLKAHLALKRA